MFSVYFETEVCTTVATAQLQFRKLALAMTSNQPHSHPLPKLFLRNTCISFIFMK